MLRVVLDTNIIVSGTIAGDGPPFKILEAWRRNKFILLTSVNILDEIEQVFNYPRIKDRYGLAPKTIVDILTCLGNYSIVTPHNISVNEITQDPCDNMFLECAIEGAADYIVTGDRHLLDLSSYEKIPIITARQFVQTM